MSDGDDDSPREKVPLIHKCFRAECPKGNPPTTLRCSRCREAYYCGKECQRADYSAHRTFCLGHKERALAEASAREKAAAEERAVTYQLLRQDAEIMDRVSQEIDAMVQDSMERMPKEYRERMKLLEEARASMNVPHPSPPGLVSYGVGVEIPLAAMMGPSMKKLG
jgi:hypothetical protein